MSPLATQTCVNAQKVHVIISNERGEFYFVQPEEGPDANHWTFLQTTLEAYEQPAIAVRRIVEHYTGVKIDDEFVECADEEFVPNSAEPWLTDCIFHVSICSHDVVYRAHDRKWFTRDQIICRNFSAVDRRILEENVIPLQS